MLCWKQNTNWGWPINPIGAGFSHLSIIGLARFAALLCASRPNLFLGTQDSHPSAQIPPGTYIAIAGSTRSCCRSCGKAARARLRTATAANDQAVAAEHRYPALPMAMADAAHRAATQQMMLQMQLNASLSSARCIGDPMICVTAQMPSVASHGMIPAASAFAPTQLLSASTPACAQIPPVCLKLIERVI